MKSLEELRNHFYHPLNLILFCSLFAIMTRIYSFEPQEYAILLLKMKQKKPLSISTSSFNY